MTKTRFNIIETDPVDTAPIMKNRNSSSLSGRMKEMEARFERQWLVDPEQFNPYKNCMQSERQERIWNLLRIFVEPKDKSIVDIGCGFGALSLRLKEAGAHVTAVDTAENALKLLKKRNSDIETIRGTMPMTPLPDQTFDVVICDEVIAELPQQDYRLFFAELARLVKLDGYILCSTPIDIYTDGGVDRFIDLAQTELNIKSLRISHHALYLRTKHCCEMPNRYVEGWLRPDLRKKELSLRSGLSKWWYWLNTTFIFMWFWLALQTLTNPFLRLLKRNRFILLGMERICRFFWADSGISHVLLIGQIRPIEIEKSHQEHFERLGKKQVWE